MTATFYSSADNGGFDDGMPVFRPGEVREAPPPVDAAQPARSENAAEAPEPVRESQAPQPAAAGGEGDEAGEIARENQMEELHPFTSVPGGPAVPYLKTMTGRTSQEIADIAQAQYPGSTVRMGKSGRPIIKMPEGATRLEARPAIAMGAALLGGAQGYSEADDDLAHKAQKYGAKQPRQ